MKTHTRMATLALTLALLAGLVPRAEAGWGYRMPITFDGYNRGEVLTNVPVLVVFSNGVGSSGFSFTDHPFVSPNGYDLRFYTNPTDTGAGLDYEIESWNTNGASYVWVRVPTLPGDGSGTLYAQWGNTVNSSQLPCTTNGAVWTNGYIGVWHLGSSTGLATNDSTANHYQGRVVTTNVIATNGAVAGAAHFGGGAAAITNGSLGALPAQGTIEFWMRLPSQSSYPNPLSTKYNGGNGCIRWEESGASLSVAIGNDGGTFSGLTYYPSGMPTQKWLSIGLTWNTTSNTATGWLNGTSVVSAAQTYWPSAIPNFSIGSGFDTTRGWVGGIDEVRVSSVARSSNWIWACYANQASNTAFATYGAVSAVDTNSPQIGNLAPTDVDVGEATFNGYLLANGSSPAAVYVVWGQTNGAWSEANWWNPNDWGDGTYPWTHIATLASDANYYYTFGASNAWTNVVASGVQYLITGVATVQATDPTGRVSLADTAAFTVYRPANCTNEDLAVSFTLGGTATNGVQYTTTPAASGANGTVIIPRGQTSAVVTVNAVYQKAGEQTVGLTLLAGNYAIGSPNTAECMLAAVAGYTYNDVATGNWNATNTWTPAGYPVTNDLAIIDSHTVSLTNHLRTGTNAPMSITLDGPGVLQSQLSWTTLQVDSPMTLKGGTIRGLENGGYRMQFNGPMTVTGSNTWDARYIGYLTMAGPISGTGMVTETHNSHWNSAVTIASAFNTNWTGTFNLTGTQGGSFTVRTNQGLGSVTANLYGSVPPALIFGDPGIQSAMTDVHDYRAIPAPRINVFSNGQVTINNNWASVSGGGFNVTVMGVDIALNGGRLAFGPLAIGRCGGRLFVTNGAANVYGIRDYRWGTDNYLDSEIIGNGRLVFDADRGAPGYSTAGRNFHLTGNNTNFSGGVTLLFNNLYVEHTNALGSGDCWFNACNQNGSPTTPEKVFLANAAGATHWVLGNNLGGTNTIQVESGTGAYRLTSRGAMIQPGPSAGVAGVLTIGGAYAFAQADGQCATLRVDVAQVGSVAGTCYDQLSVTKGDATLAASITNCVLALNMIRAESEMNGEMAVVLKAPGADFSVYTFAAVTGTGAAARVIYASNTVSVTWDTGAPVIRNASYTNLGDTLCDVMGTLVSTGRAATEVYVYWGTNDMASGTWPHANYLGIQAMGLVTGSLTGLTSNTRYYYRFYATNAFGDNLAPATSNFITLANVSWNDVTNGNWVADNANTWGQGTNVYPQNALNDRVTVDSHTVTLYSNYSIVAREVTVGTSAGATGTLAFANTYGQSQAVVMNGGRLGVMSSDNSGVQSVVLNGNLLVKAASQLHVLGIGNRLNPAVNTMNGNIMDYGPGTTGVMRVDGDVSTFPGINYLAAGRMIYNGVSTNFTGGWLIQSADVQALDGGFWFGVYKDGGLGASTVTVTRGELLIAATQSGAAPLPAPARVIVNTEGRFAVNNGVNVTNWTVDLNGGQLWWFGTSKFSGGSLNMNSNSLWWGSAAGNKEYAGTIAGAGRLDLNPSGGYGPFILSSNNSGFSGGVRLMADSLTVAHTNGLGTGPVMAASATGGKLTLDRPGGSFDWTLANNLSGGCTNGATAVAIQVEDGAGTNTLMVLGTVDPGTNTAVSGATNILSILRVDGSVAFGAGSRLRIDISGMNGVAGVDFDRLLVDHMLSGLGNAVLEVNVSTNLTKNALQGQEFLIISNAAPLAGRFASVTWSERWGGQVRYNDPAGTVKLVQVGLPVGSVLMVY